MPDEQDPPAMRSLADLPVELIYDILILSSSPALPLLNRRIHAVCSSAPSSVRAQYLISSYLAVAPPPTPPRPPYKFVQRFDNLGRSVRTYSVPPEPEPERVPSSPTRPLQALWLPAHALLYPLCTLPVFLALERLCGADPPSPSSTEDESFWEKPWRHGGLLRPPTRDLDSALWNLPKRLFSDLPVCRDLPSTSPVSATTGDAATSSSSSSSSAASAAGQAGGKEDPYPLLHHLLTRYPFNPTSHSGYPLAMAVKAPHLPLMRLLLAKGANPGVREGVAVRIAVAKKELGLVRMLVERTGEEVDLTLGGRAGAGVGAGTSASVTGVAAKGPGAAEQSKRVEAGEDNEAPKPAGQKKRKRTTDPDDPEPERKRQKRRKLADRIPVDASMLQLAVKLDARDIVEWLMEKGCVPDMKTLRLVR